MTGIADFYLLLKRPNSRNRRKRFLAHFVSSNDDETTRFVVLSWKRTGSNWLCGILHRHPEICMHNELFNPVDIFTYHPKVLRNTSWSVLTRDLLPMQFLEDFVWNPEISGMVRPNAKAVGFKSFPDHWMDVRNENVWQECILQDLRIKKIILHRQDELAVYVSMQRADRTGHYLTHNYPADLKIRVDPAAFQAFVNHYRYTFRVKYQSPMAKRDSFIVTYEEMMDEKHFVSEIVPKLWSFLGVDATVPVQKLRETVKQADPMEDLEDVIENYDELELSFRHSDVSHFVKKREFAARLPNPPSSPSLQNTNGCIDSNRKVLASWSILLPICSRSSAPQAPPAHDVNDTTPATAEKFNTNRFLELALSSQHTLDVDSQQEKAAWDLLDRFCWSLLDSMSQDQAKKTECIIGIDVDDPVFGSSQARTRIQAMLPCLSIVFVPVHPVMYGHVCKIWNLLAGHARNDFIVLLGDDVHLLDKHWQQRIVQEFVSISETHNLPLGAACVALKDLSFPGFPTFPVLHRWHLDIFGTLLPKQFVNQGGDPYLYELYARFNASRFCSTTRLRNTIGGDGDARYRKHQINWRGQILSMNLRKLKTTLGAGKMKGIVLDIVVPCYRTNNNEFLERIARLRATVVMYVRFWFVVDNPCPKHVASVKELASKLNQNAVDQNYFISVIHYGDNRGASYARNTGFNYSTADWVLFLDDDVIPDENLLDAYAGAIARYPYTKVFCGLTELPEACNFWTEILRTCNIGFFYGIAKEMVHPSWGVTANLLVRGPRFNSTIQFKSIYPKTGGGEDIDLVYQFKDWYKSDGRRVVVGVPEAKVQHPWWNGGRSCYRQIMGWAYGDSLCITEWSNKTFLAFPNWIEYSALILPTLSLYTGRIGLCCALGLGTTTLEHIVKAVRYFPAAQEHGSGSIWRQIVTAVGAGTVLSAQEITRVAAMVRRGSLYSFCRRVDWFDGQEERIKLDIQLGSMIRFGLNAGLTYCAFRVFKKD